MTYFTDTFSNNNTQLQLTFNDTDLDDTNLNQDDYEPNTLFLGAGNFSLPLAFVEKHMRELYLHGNTDEAENFPKTVIATELKTEEECKNDHFTNSNITTLEELGSLVLYDVDGQHIDTDPDLEPYLPSINRIQFDCPDNSRIFCDHTNELPHIIKNTAKAAANILNPGSTLHYTLITPEENSHVWQGSHYDITKVEDEGFYLNEGAPRQTGSNRYPGYEHQKTEGDEKVTAAQLDEMSEFVFVRDDEFRTPDSFKSTYKGFQQIPVEGRKPQKTNFGDYKYYDAEPGPPTSPTIRSPSNFKNSNDQLFSEESGDEFELEQLDESFEAGLAELDRQIEEDRNSFEYELKELDRDLEEDHFNYDGEFSDLLDLDVDPKRQRMNIRNQCRSVVKRVNRTS